MTAFPITSGFFPSSFLHSFKFLSQTMSLLTFALPTLFLVPLAGDISKQLWWGQAITKGEKKKKSQGKMVQDLSILLSYVYFNL